MVVRDKAPWWRCSYKFQAIFSYFKLCKGKVCYISSCGQTLGSCKEQGIEGAHRKPSHKDIHRLQQKCWSSLRLRTIQPMVKPFLLPWAFCPSLISPRAALLHPTVIIDLVRGNTKVKILPCALPSTRRRVTGLVIHSPP